MRKCKSIILENDKLVSSLIEIINPMSWLEINGVITDKTPSNKKKKIR
jgi:hypothetical protein